MERADRGGGAGRRGADRGRLDAALAEAIEAGGVGDATIAASEAQAEAFWKLRESMSEAEARDGIAAKHDIAVPVAAMPGFMAEAAAAVEARFPGVRPIAFGHLGDGNVHFNVRAPSGGDDRAWFAANAAAVSAFVHGLVTEAGGSLSAEHGIGQIKRADFLRLTDPARLAAMLRGQARARSGGNHEPRGAAAACRRRGRAIDDDILTGGGDLSRPLSSGEQGYGERTHSGPAAVLQRSDAALERGACRLAVSARRAACRF